MWHSVWIHVSDVDWWRWIAHLLKDYAAVLALTVASISAIVAYLAMRTQRDIARKRATLDMFIKTEIDSHALNMWDNFLAARSDFETHGDAKCFLSLPAGKEETKTPSEKICAYLNILELVACGIKAGVLDKKITKAFFGPTVVHSYVKLKDFIAALQLQPGNKKRYCEFVDVAKDWEKQLGPQIR